MQERNKKGLSPETRSFLTAIIVLLVLMVVTFVLTRVLPAGEYAYVTNEAGQSVIDTEVPFTFTEGGIPVWKWLLSPLLVLSADGSTMVIAILIFLLVIGGIFSSLQESGMMGYMIGAITHRFLTRRYLLAALLMLFFMGMGAFIGSFEEVIPLVPILCTLAVSLGWDNLTGISISLLAVGCGFSCGITNPFSIGIAQSLAGLPMFSGVGLRILTFCIVYAMLCAFVLLHARHVEKPVDTLRSDHVKDPVMGRAVMVYGIIMACVLAVVMASTVITALQDYTLIIVALGFLVAGIVACILARMPAKAFFATFFHGVLGVLPAVLMILMASSIKYTLTEAKVLDTLLYYIIGATSGLPRWSIILIMYAIVLVMEVFVSSGSAKAFMLMPLLLPIAQMSGISYQLCILAFAFGDGFSNVIYPTNPGLLISLGLAGTSYVEWLKYAGRFLLAVLAVTALILLCGLAMGY